MDRLTMTFPCVPNVDAYSVLGQKDGDPTWAVIVSVPQNGCVNGKISTTFDHINGPAKACYRVLTVNFVGSASTTTMICHDPSLEAPPVPQTIEGGQTG